MLTYLLAVLAAGANATSSVLQRKANRRAPRRENMSLRLIWSLAHEPVWFGGILAVTVGFLLQAAALGGGQLSVVEPILVLELPATLILASRVFETRMHRREWGRDQDWDGRDRGDGAAWRVMILIRLASVRRCCGSTRWSRTASGAGLSARTVT